MTNYTPDGDGTTHINVYSHGKSDIGRMLTNFAETPFKHPKLGYFVSVEGFWYYIKTGMVENELRRLYGNSAKFLGNKLPVVQMDETEFRTLIKEAIRAKITQTPVLYRFFVQSTLPFAHYYVFSGKVVHQPKHQWQMDYLEELRKELRDKIDQTPQDEI